MRFSRQTSVPYISVRLRNKSLSVWIETAILICNTLIQTWAISCAEQHLRNVSLFKLIRFGVRISGGQFRYFGSLCGPKLIFELIYVAS